MNRILIILCLFTVSLQAADISNNKVSKDTVESAISRIEADENLLDKDREKLLASMKRTLGLLNSADSFRERTEEYVAAAATAPEKIARFQAVMAQDNEADNKIRDDISVTELEHLIQQAKIELADTRTTLAEISAQLRIESTRLVDVRNREERLNKSLEATTQQIRIAQKESPSLPEQTLIWQLHAEADAISAEIGMLDEEVLSQPARLELLKITQDSETRLADGLGKRIKANEQFVIEQRRNEAEKALSEAESALQNAAGKHTVILLLAERNTKLSTSASDIADKLQKARASELTAREEANRFEKDLETFERKLEIVGMSRAMGQVLRDQQMRLPNRQYSGESASRREEQISAASLLLFEYEEERRNLNDLAVYVAELTEGLPEAEAATISQDLHILASARKEMIETVLDAERSYLRALGDLDFTERRLLVAADAYRAFVAERLLWIRTSAPVSLDTFLAIPSEISRVFAPRQWIDLIIAFPAHLFSSVVPLLMVVVFGIIVRARAHLFAMLKSSGDQVGSVTRDRLYYSYQALGVTILLALKWPFLMFILGISIKSMPEQTAATGALGLALTNVSYYFFGFEILRHLTFSEGLWKRHFRWPLDTLVPLGHSLISLERIFVPAAVISIMSADFYRSEGDSVVSMFAVITAQVALAVFFFRMPSFMASKLDYLLTPGQGTSRSFWGRLIRNLLVLTPCLLIITMLLGYGATSIEFLRLLLLTIALFSGLLIVHEFGIRWLQLIRARLIKAERESARAAAAAAAATTASEVETETIEDRIDDWDTATLDDDGRKLLTALLGLGAIVGVWIIWADVLPALGILNTIELWDHSVIIDGRELQMPVTLADIALAIMVGFVGYVAVQRTPGLLEMVLRQKMEIPAGTVYASITLFRYGLITLVVVSILGLLGGRWSQIQWAVAALSVGIGFGLQEIVANFICGLILLFEQPIRVGDTVTVGETSGVVTRIRMRATTIRDWDRRELLVPNKEFITGRLLNWSLSDQLTRFVVVIGVAYGTNLKKAMELAIEAAQEHPDVLDDPAPFITFDEFGDNSLQLVLRCFMGSVDKRLTTSSQIRLAVNDKFNEAGIVVAFPQRDVHFDASVPLEINIRSSQVPSL